MLSPDHAAAVDRSWVHVGRHPYFREWNACPLIPQENGLPCNIMTPLMDLMDVDKAPQVVVCARTAAWFLVVLPKTAKA